MSEQEPAYLDLLGQPIAVGSYIGYGAALGRCNIIKMARVTALVTKTEERYMPGGRGTEVKTATLRVITAEMRADWEAGVHKGDIWCLQGTTAWYAKPKPGKKPYRIMTLSFLSRLIVVDGEKLPAQLKELLDTAYAVECPKPESPEYGDGLGGAVF